MILLWHRRDLRLDDHAALLAASETGGPVVPVFIYDQVMEAQYGAAAKWRLARALEALGAAYEAKGLKLILRRGDALENLRALAEETGAKGIYWSRLYDSASLKRDKAVKSALIEAGLDAQSFNTHLLHEPWTIETKTGGPYKVYSPFAKACLKMPDPPEAQPAPRDFSAPQDWPNSEELADLGLDAAMNRGAEILAKHAVVGEKAARDRLEDFLAHKLGVYKVQRDRPDCYAVSGLSENLAWGEISPRRIWRRTLARFEAEPGDEKEGFHFLKELLWREFAYHLLYHFPTIEHENWRDQWDEFPWREDNDDAERWRRGLTGVPMVDAAMREMYVTGTMHNRTRMLVASFLTKHLLTHWKVGEAWFRDCLIDWDPASNALGWQWTAGSGPDAAPYFRIYNPETQARKFDPNDHYVDRFVAELSDAPGEEAQDYFKAIPRRWKMRADDPYPDPIIDLQEGRERALAAYEEVKGG